MAIYGAASHPRVCLIRVLQWSKENEDLKELLRCGLRGMPCDRRLQRSGHSLGDQWRKMASSDEHHVGDCMIVVNHAVLDCTWLYAKLYGRRGPWFEGRGAYHRFADCSHGCCGSMFLLDSTNLQIIGDQLFNGQDWAHSREAAKFDGPLRDFYGVI